MKKAKSVKPARKVKSSLARRLKWMRDNWGILTSTACGISVVAGGLFHVVSNDHHTNLQETRKVCRPLYQYVSDNIAWGNETKAAFQKNAQSPKAAQTKVDQQLDDLCLKLEVVFKDHPTFRKAYDEYDKSVRFVYKPMEQNPEQDVFADQYTQFRGAARHLIVEIDKVCHCYGEPVPESPISMNTPRLRDAAESL